MSSVIAVGCVALAACAASTTAVQRPQQQVTKATAPRHTHEGLNAVLWMQTAVEYRASALQAYHVARLALDAALADRKETAALEQTTDASALPPAVVLDLDETVLDNSPYDAREIVDVTGYTDPSFAAWAREEKAGAIPGAIEFLEYARSRGVLPIYITNRDAAIEEPTRHVLARLGAPLDPSVDTVLMRNENGWSGDKGPRRAFVASRYRVLLLVGDNFEDFMSVPAADKTLQGRTSLFDRYADYFGTRWIVLPNPAYGSWEQAITAGVPPSDDPAILARKYATLNVAK